MEHSFFTVKDEVPFDWKTYKRATWNVEDDQVNGKQKILISTSTDIEEKEMIKDNVRTFKRRF